MGDIVNLRRARKQNEARRAEREAAANRIRFGAPKAERRAIEKERAKAERELEARRLVGPDDPVADLEPRSTGAPKTGVPSKAP